MQSRHTPKTYLSRLDAHLATVDREKRAEIIEDEIRRTYQAEQALEKWARCGAGRRPTPFSALELSAINLELSKRLVATREQVGALMAAE